MVGKTDSKLINYGPPATWLYILVWKQTQTFIHPNHSYLLSSALQVSTVGTVLTTEVAVNFENFFEGVLAVN